MPFPSPRRFRTRFLLLTAFLILLYYHLPSGTSIFIRLRHLTTPPDTGPHVGPPVVHEVQDTPRFQYYSPFRDSPDVKFEQELDLALRAVEETVRREWESGIVDEWPRKIWQVWLSKGWKPGDPDNEGFGLPTNPDGEENMKVKFMNAWKKLNPDYEYSLLTDLTADTFVSTFYSSIPSLVHLFRTLPVPVMKADLLRYLLLFAHGGAWVDHDVYPVHPLSTCPFEIHLPTSGVSPHTTLIVGLEIDEPYVTDHTKKVWHWSRIYGFIQYHMVAKPFSPFLRRAIVRVVAHAYAHGHRKSGGIRNLWPWASIDGGVWTGEYSEREILEITGPGVWTDAVLDTLTTSARALGATPQAHDLMDVVDGMERVTWRPFTGISNKTEIVLTPKDAEAVGLIVLPINYWGNGQRHSGAKNFNAEEACVNHLFLRSWKKGWWEWAFG